MKGEYHWAEMYVKEALKDEFLAKTGQCWFHYHTLANIDAVAQEIIEDTDTVKEIQSLYALSTYPVFKENLPLLLKEKGYL